MGECLGVIGDPIEHSISPVMHNFWFEEKQMSDHYHSFHVVNEQLKEAVLGIKALGLKGINVTIPHKVNIMPYLDDIDSEAELIGAVNTVVNNNGILKGYNTDGLGFLQALKETFGDQLSIQHVLFIGAGGAAKACALALAKHVGCDIDIANRTLEKGRTLSLQCQKWVESYAITLEDASKQLSKYDMIVNTTPVGMYPDSEKIPMPLFGVRRDTYCIDLIYRPAKTKWLEHAESLGCKTMNGLGMLVNQGALAFQHWFNIWPNTKVATDHLIKYLEEQDAK